MSKAKPKAALIDTLMAQMKLAGVLHFFEREFRFDASRQWRIDLYSRTHRLGIEVEGGVWARRATGHVTGSGFLANCEKYNAIALAGITLLRFEARMINPQPLRRRTIVVTAAEKRRRALDGSALPTILEALRIHKG